MIGQPPRLMQIGRLGANDHLLLAQVLIKLNY